uniref:Malate dehydrogenase n=1 Tax=Ditylenchus dipsaci TaxID=166011 RepID=A0A915DDF8_9BILA
MSDDPCECVFNHEAMMRRLLSLLRDSQADCTDTDCTTSTMTGDGSGGSNMMLIAMAWGLLAMFMFFLRPSSMRSNNRNNQGQLEGKPSQAGGDGPGNEPPAPDTRTKRYLHHNYESFYLYHCCCNQNIRLLHYSSPKMSASDQYVVPVDQMRQFVHDCMVSVGANPQQSLQLADLLISADMRGHYSHGLNRLRIYMEDVHSGICKTNGHPKVLKQKGGTAWVDGDNALGVVVGNFCTDLAMQLAKEHGIGWVVAKMIEQGFVGMAFTNTSPLMYPNRAAQVGLGTNPISCIAAANSGDNFALDMATTTVALGKVDHGQPTDNPTQVVDGGALLPLGGSEQTGGYKGTGLAMMVELFCGMLAGSKYGKNMRTWRETAKVADCGQCFVALDPECFAPGFANRLQQFLDETRALKPVTKSEKAGGLIYGKAQIEHLEDIAQKNKVQKFTYKQLK